MQTTGTVLRRRDQEPNMAQFHSVDVHPDLLDGWSPVRQWGTLGQRRKVRIEPFDDLASTEAAGSRIERIKRRRG